MECCWLEWTQIWQYILLFGLAATPWLEVFLVVPLGIAWGLNPIAVGVVGFLGNWIPILLIAAFFEQLKNWMRRRRALKKGVSLDEIDEAEVVPETKASRARKIWDRYGIPGLALIAPSLVGTDIAAVLALTFGSSKRWVVLWMTISLALWTILLSVGSHYGLDFIGWFDQG